MSRKKQNPRKVVLIFVEGDTEKEFFEKLTQLWKAANSTEVVIKNVKGIGNYQKKPYNIFSNSIESKHDNCNYLIFFAYDTDAFEFSPKPPVNWNEVENQFRQHKNVICNHLPAVRNIEDWFLSDLDGLCKFLRIDPKKANIKGKTGLEKIQKLFKLGNKAYLKGTRIKGLLDILNLGIIYKAQKATLGKLKKFII